MIKTTIKHEKREVQIVIPNKYNVQLQEVHIVVQESSMTSNTGVGFAIKVNKFTNTLSYLTQVIDHKNIEERNVFHYKIQRIHNLKRLKHIIT